VSGAGDPSKDRLDRALEDKHESSGQVSANNRFISFGLVAITWTILTSDASFAATLLAAHPFWVLLVGAIGCLGVLFDYLHYSCAAEAATKAINNKTKDHEHQYNENWAEYKWRNRFYFLRTAASVVGTLMLIVLIALSWFTLHRQEERPGYGPGWNIHRLAR
jgi:uncharacterized membrane protein YdcZ (DUF606 family)